jgi:hypothetical protein
MASLNPLLTINTKLICRTSDFLSLSPITNLFQVSTQKLRVTETSKPSVPRQNKAVAKQAHSSLAEMVNSSNIGSIYRMLAR